MNILVFNWRDVKNPLAGGAEVYIQQIFSRVAERGDKVFLFTSAYENSITSENIEGINVIRKGGKYTVYIHAFLFYLRNRKNFELAVESINTIPFFLPFFVKKRRIAIIHHLAGAETYDLELNPFMSAIVKLIQASIPKIYKNTQIITVSESTMLELSNKGIKKDRLSVVHCGVDLPQKFRPNDYTKFLEPTVIYFGRVKKLKRVEQILYAFAKVQNEVPKANLIVAGRGDANYYNELRKIVSKYGLKNVKLLGSLKEEEKEFYLAKSWVYAIASVKEGWGISVIEANTYGLPVVAYDVPGIRDSVKAGYSGLMINDGNLIELSLAIKKLLTNDELREKLSENAREWASRFDWQLSASNFLKSMT